MATVLSPAEWEAQLRDFEHTAFRLELQPRYNEPDEDEMVRRFLAGDPIPPEDDPPFLEWLARVAAQAAEGRRMARVRVFEDPPTDYQRWLLWVSRWNVEAGEDIRYMTRARAYEVGLLPAAGSEDWWLLDSERLVIMRFDPDGNRGPDELVTDPARVVQACMWRDLAVHHSAPASYPG